MSIIPLPAPPAPTAQMLPPGEQLEIVFSFDTTGSMSECLEQVRAQLRHVIERLFADIPGLRIAVFAHGDYCDLDMYGYVTKHVDFTNDVAELCRFVGEVEATGGGDFEECYELVLRQVRELLSWQPGSQRALVMIGDATPHEPDSAQNAQGIDWRQEASRLNNTHIYAVQCLNNPVADSFYRHLADTTGGRHLKLDELTNIVDMMMAICYREKGAEFIEDFEQEVRQRDGAAMRLDLDRMFIALKDQPSTAGPSCSSATHGDILNGAPSSAHDVTDDIMDSNSEDSDWRPQASSAGSSSYAGSSSFAASYVDKLDDAESSNESIGHAFSPTRPRAGSVSSSRSSDTSGGTAGTSGSGGSRGSHRRRSSGVMTRSRAHPMNLRHREPIRRLAKDRRSKPKQTPSQRCLERALRERQHGDQFVLSDLSWSRWQQAMTTTAPPTAAWQHRPRDHPGDRKRMLYDDMTSASVYEVAVQAPNSAAKTPVLGFVTKGFRRCQHWETALLSRKPVRTRVDDVLNKGCKLYVRRAHVTPRDLPLVAKRCGVTGNVRADSDDDDATSGSGCAVRELRRLMGLVCDYAWTPRYHTPAGNTAGRVYTQRPLRRKGIFISE